MCSVFDSSLENALSGSLKRVGSNCPPYANRYLCVSVFMCVGYTRVRRAGACVFRVIRQPETRGQQVPTLRKPIFVRIRFYVCWLYTGKADGGLRISCYRAA